MRSWVKGRTPRALITGGSGFLGSHLCDAMIKKGFHVTCVDNFLTGSPRPWDHRRAPRRVSV